LSKSELGAGAAETKPTSETNEASSVEIFMIIIKAVEENEEKCRKLKNPSSNC